MSNEWDFVCPGCFKRQGGWGPIFCKECRDAGRDEPIANVFAERNDLRAQLDQERQRTAEARWVAQECWRGISYADRKQLYADVAARHPWLTEQD